MKKDPKQEGSQKRSLPEKLVVYKLLYPSILTESCVKGKSVVEKVIPWTQATTITFLVLIHSRTRDIRSVLSGLTIKFSRLLLSGPKSSFHMKVKYLYKSCLPLIQDRVAGAAVSAEIPKLPSPKHHLQLLRG
ncbi:hypothetical protein ILYODFUR_023737 [Ilyodon furcidens]|uniref:Uncharacterized protein n=1 Tax=Ilyodon furcidens TaxID=33524 RepID=A0ABV0VI05_9TELE